MAHEPRAYKRVPRKVQDQKLHQGIKVTDYISSLGCMGLVPAKLNDGVKY